MSFSAQKKFISRITCSSFKWWKAKNDFRCTVALHAKKVYPFFEFFRVPSSGSEQSTKILKTWSQQIEFILAHRIRRSFQMITLYKKLWGGFTLNSNYQRFTFKDIIKRFYFTVCLAPVFQWDEKRIRPEELSQLKNEFYNAKYFSNQFAVKPDPSITKNEAEDENICNCDRCSHLSNVGWSLFYHGVGLQIFRKEHMNYKDQGLYVYKVFGHFNDVSASDFFQVQIDTDYRKEWDPNSVELRVVDSDPESNSDILYWEFLFPSMFYNRDYVCNRRYEVDHKNKIMAIVSESVEHPACPPKPPVHRVKEYWSHTVIKPLKDSFEEPGMEFTITYFDNPELSVPNYISVWYTAIGMPDYIMKQKQAAMQLAERRRELEIAGSNRPVVNKEPVGQNESQGRRFLLV